MAKKSIGPAGELSRAASAEIRADLGRLQWTQTDLAERVGKSKNYINTRLRDEAPLNINDIEEIGRALGRSPGDLFRAAVENYERRQREARAAGKED